jgi:hypothetical protein
MNIFRGLSGPFKVIGIVFCCLPVHYHFPDKAGIQVEVHCPVQYTAISPRFHNKSLDYISDRFRHTVQRNYSFLNTCEICTISQFNPDYKYWNLSFLKFLKFLYFFSLSGCVSLINLLILIRSPGFNSVIFGSML